MVRLQSTKGITQRSVAGRKDGRHGLRDRGRGVYRLEPLVIALDRFSGRIQLITASLSAMVAQSATISANFSLGVQ